MRSKFLLAAALFVSAVSMAPASAQDATHDPGRVRPGTYTVEPDHTQIIFGVLHLGFSTYYGQFARVSGSLDLSPANPAASHLDVTLPIASVFTSSGKLDGELKGADWFDAARFPQARFQSTSVTPTGPNSADIAGNLTLHGITRPVTLKARFVGAGRNPVDGSYNVGFSATGAIRRSEFGVTKYIPLVGDEVDLTISGAFVRQ